MIPNAPFHRNMYTYMRKRKSFVLEGVHHQGLPVVKSIWTKYKMKKPKRKKSAKKSTNSSTSVKTDRLEYSVEH